MFEGSRFSPLSSFAVILIVISERTPCAPGEH